MKPIQATVHENSLGNHAFLAKEIKLPYFATEFHFHKECQLVYIVESSGQRIVGDSVEHFEEGELVFLGSDIPHVWQNDKKYFQNSDKANAHSFGLYISPGVLLENLSGIGDVETLKSWLLKSQRGMLFGNATKNKVVPLMKKIIHQEGFEKIVTFFEVLLLLCNAKDYRLLAGNNYVNLYTYNDQSRMDKVFKYIFSNFKKEISLKEISTVAGLNVYSFCRFFKSRTQKPFITFVNELRIGHACKLLHKNEFTMVQLADKSGYNNVTHFNRYFKRFKGVTPKEYRRRITLNNA
jgi:AraC-like DNA-binding protein